MRTFYLLVLCIFLSAIPVAAQETGVPGDRLVWDQPDADAPTLRYRVSWDGAAAAITPTTCAAGSPAACAATLPATMTAGNHTAIVTASRLLSDGREVSGSASVALAFRLVAVPGQPGRLRLEAPPTQLVMPPPGDEQ